MPQTIAKKVAGVPPSTQVVDYAGPPSDQLLLWYGPVEILTGTRHFAQNMVQRAVSHSVNGKIIDGIEP
jgi:hypothetical protein